MRFGISIVASLLAMASTAWNTCEAGTVTVRWRCEQRYDAVFNAECIVEDHSALIAAAQSGARSETPIETGRSFYLPVAMRSPQEILANAIWKVPVYGVPLNHAEVILLLQSVLCGKAVDCSVQYEPGIHVASPRTPHPFIR